MLGFVFADSVNVKRAWDWEQTVYFLTPNCKSPLPKNSPHKYNTAPVSATPENHWAQHGGGEFVFRKLTSLPPIPDIYEEHMHH